MKRRNFIKTAAILSAASCTGDSQVDSKKKPNLLVLVSDDQRYDMLGCSGHPLLQTPAIDRLASNGFRFENMFVTTPICAASRASIFIGLYERAHGYTFKTGSLSNQFSEKSYPKVLKENGYFTGFVGKLGVSVDGEFRKNNFNYYQQINRTPYFHQLPDGKLLHETDAAAVYAQEFIDRAKESGLPFNLNISFNAPHAARSEKVDRPFPPPPEVDGMYDGVDIGVRRFTDSDYFNSLPEFLRESLNRIRHEWRWASEDEYQRNMRDYLSMISGIDNSVAKIISYLDSVGELENTVILYTSDNGFYLGDRGFAGKWSHFDESTRVPLIIFDPSANQEGSVIQDFVLNVDINATLLDYAGLDSSSSQGVSLKPIMQGEQSGEWRDDFLLEHLLDSSDMPKWEGVRSQQYLYARYFEQNPVFEFMYDLRKDPNQIHNLASDPDYRTVLDSMRLRCTELIVQRSQWS